MMRRVLDGGLLKREREKGTEINSTQRVRGALVINVLVEVYIHAQLILL
jgi:hypothetical protein